MLIRPALSDLGRIEERQWRCNARPKEWQTTPLGFSPGRDCPIDAQAGVIESFSKSETPIRWVGRDRHVKELAVPVVYQTKEHAPVVSEEARNELKEIVVGD